MKLTLNQTWRECLKMWKWIVEQIDFKTFHKIKNKTRYIERLKREYLKSINLDNVIMMNCFFCEYDDKHEDECQSCPGRLAVPDFRCINKSYSWSSCPDKFYAKLLELDKKRKSK